MATYRSITVTIGAMRIEALAAEAASAPSLRPTFIALQFLTHFGSARLAPAVAGGSIA